MSILKCYSTRYYQFDFLILELICNVVMKVSVCENYCLYGECEVVEGNSVCFCIPGYSGDRETKPVLSNHFLCLKIIIIMIYKSYIFPNPLSKNFPFHNLVESSKQNMYLYCWEIWFQRNGSLKSFVWSRTIELTMIFLFKTLLFFYLWFRYKSAFLNAETIEKIVKI